MDDEKQLLARMAWMIDCLHEIVAENTRIIDDLPDVSMQTLLDFCKINSCAYDMIGQVNDAITMYRVEKHEPNCRFDDVSTHSTQ